MGFTNSSGPGQRPDGLPIPLGSLSAFASFSTGNGFLIPPVGVLNRIVLVGLRLGPPLSMSGTGEVDVNCTINGLIHHLIVVYGGPVSNAPSILSVPIQPVGLALDYGTGVSWSSSAAPSAGAWNLFAEYDVVTPTG